MHKVRLVYGATCYAIGLGSILYMIGWLGGFVVPVTIETGISSGAALQSSGVAAAINGALFLLFGLQHSVMARPWFKQRLTKLIDKSVERSTYVLFSGVAMTGMMLLWQPMTQEIWSVSGTGKVALHAIYALGWIILVGSTFALNHFDLFGLRQVILQAFGGPYTELPFATPGPYRMVRHPIYVGWITLVWAAPTMSLGHLLFAVGTTVYILVAVQFEERDLVDIHGEKYIDYRATTPMLIPTLPKRQGVSTVNGKA